MTRSHRWPIAPSMGQLAPPRPASAARGDSLYILEYVWILSLHVWIHSIYVWIISIYVWILAAKIAAGLPQELALVAVATASMETLSGVPLALLRTGATVGDGLCARLPSHGASVRAGGLSAAATLPGSGSSRAEALDGSIGMAALGWQRWDGSAGMAALRWQR